MVNKGVLFDKYDVPRLTNGFDVTYNIKLNIPRGGCIFYTIENGQLYFCLGRDRQTLELTDFGGMKKRYETITDCSSREANEETMSAFGNITPKTIMENLVIYNKYMLICFVPVVSDEPGVSVRDITRGNFASRLNSGPHPKEELEMKELVWLTYEQLLSACTETFLQPELYMFTRVRRFLCSFFNEMEIVYQPNSSHLQFVKKEKSSLKHFHHSHSNPNKHKQYHFGNKRVMHDINMISQSSMEMATATASTLSEVC